MQLKFKDFLLVSLFSCSIILFFTGKELLSIIPAIILIIMSAYDWFKMRKEQKKVQNDKFKTLK